jgi:TRAP-type uncharacterized transport system substrate-binding protein
MTHRKISVMLSVAGLITAMMLPCTATAQPVAATNRGVIEIETSSTGGISVKIAEDLANLIDD